MSFHSDPEMRDELRKPFDPKQIGRLPQTAKRPAMDFVGHAAVTDRLNKAAPDWTYSDIVLFDHGGQVWIKGTMTIGGVSRIEYGDGDDPKQALGNFIRRAAMRFGVALDLWSKEELNVPAPSQAGSSVGGPGQAGETRTTPRPPAPSSEGKQTKDNKVADSAPAASSGVVGAGSDGEADPAPTADEVQALYGGQAHLLRAARAQWDVRSVKDLTPVMLAELKRVKV